MKNIYLLCGTILLFQSYLFGNFPSFSSDTLSYTIKNFSHFSGKCDDTSCVSFTADYPVFDKTEDSIISDSLNNYISGLILYPVFDEVRVNSLEEFAANLDSSYYKSYEEMPLYSLPWELERSTKVIFNSSSLVSLSFEEFSFFGGAHPNSGVYLNTFDIVQKKNLTLDDILLPNTKVKLEKIGERYFRIVREIPNEQSLEAAGFWFEDNVFRLNENFAFTHDGLSFYFNSYEIGPYVMGPSYFTIPYKDFLHLLKKEFVQKLPI